MSHGKTDAEIIDKTHNTARFFVQTRHISWVLLIGTCLWGVYGYLSMPQRKDPEVQVRTAVALVPWPGASAEKVEQLVTKIVEQTIAGNAKVTKIESISRTSLAIVYLELDENLKDTSKELADIGLRLDGVTNLPQGAGPINFIRDFGDTAALMLTVASPKAGAAEIAPRAADIRTAIEAERARVSPANRNGRFTIVISLAQAASPRLLQTPANLFIAYLKEKNSAHDLRNVQGTSAFGIDGLSELNDQQLLALVQQFISERLQASELHPDAWAPVVIRDPSEIEQKLAAVAGDKYTYREMDDFTDLIDRTLKTASTVSKVDRKGVLNEQIYLLYSQERLASYGIHPSNLGNLLSARNITTGGGQINVEGKNITINPSGEFKSEKEIGDVLVPSKSGTSLDLRDLVDVVRGYQNPARYLNYFNWRGSH